MGVKYDFDTVIDRRGTDCLKYDFGMKRKGRDDLLPLWVADMDFKLPDEILAEFHKRIDHGIFGYSDPLDSYYEALNRWFSKHFGYTVKPEWVTLGAGIVYGIFTAIHAYTKPGDAVMISQPVYYPFCDSIVTNERKLVNNQLHFENGRYSFDFEDFEKKIVENDVKVYILCNPHNPVGRVWTKEEITKVADICLQHGVIVMCDEIHADFVYTGYQLTSYMTLPEKYLQNVCFFVSPGKTFNVAGLQPSNIIIPNEELRAKYRRANDQAGYSNAPIFGMLATKVCYTLGDEWVKQLVEYIEKNIAWIEGFVNENFPKATFVKPEGTYLVWIDFSGYGFTDEELEHLMLEEAKLWLDSGKIFGPETAQFERFNAACPLTTVKQCFTQLKEAFDKHIKW